VSGSVVAVGIVNTAPDARFSHASDGLLDVIVARKGGAVSSIGLLLRYLGRALGVSDERHSPLYRYDKATHALLVPAAGQEGLPANVDGEAWGPGPFAVTALPGLLLAYGEL
jgi:diacylglycerol kinase family enzyme